MKTDHFMQVFCGVHYLEFVWPVLVVPCIRTLQLHKTWYAIYLYMITRNAKSYFKIGKQKMQAIVSSCSKRTKCKYPEAIHHGLRCTWSTFQEWKEYAMKYFGGKLRCHSSWCRCPTPLLYNSRLTVAGKIKGVEVLSVVNAHDMYELQKAMC